MASKEQYSPSAFIIMSLPKRRKLVKCIICQVDKEEILRKGKGSSIDTLNRAHNLRKGKVHDRLLKNLPSFLNQDAFWHSTCYSSYTSAHNIRHATGIHESKVESEAGNEETRRVLRSPAGVHIDWSKCFIYRNKTYKKFREMHNVCIFEACESERQRQQKAKVMEECCMFSFQSTTT